MNTEQVISQAIGSHWQTAIKMPFEGCWSRMLGKISAAQDMAHALQLCAVEEGQDTSKLCEIIENLSFLWRIANIHDDNESRQRIEEIFNV